jgi:hypothetical protein
MEVDNGSDSCPGLRSSMADMWGHAHTIVTKNWMALPWLPARLVTLEMERDLTPNSWHTLLQQCPNLVDLHIHTRNGFGMSAKEWLANGHATRPWRRVIFELLGNGAFALCAADCVNLRVALGLFLQPALQVLDWNDAVVPTDAEFWKLVPVLPLLHTLRMDELTVAAKEDDAVVRTWMRIMPRLHHLSIRRQLLISEPVIAEAFRSHWPVMIPNGTFPPRAFGPAEDNDGAGLLNALDATHFAAIKTINTTNHGGWRVPWDTFFHRSMQHATWTSITFCESEFELSNATMRDILANPHLESLRLFGSVASLSHSTIDLLVAHPMLANIQLPEVANILDAMSADAFHTVFHDKRRWAFHAPGVIRHITLPEWQHILQYTSLKKFVVNVPPDTAQALAKTAPVSVAFGSLVFSD